MVGPPAQALDEAGAVGGTLGVFRAKPGCVEADGRRGHNRAVRPPPRWLSGGREQRGGQCSPDSRARTPALRTPPAPTELPGAVAGVPLALAESAVCASCDVLPGRAAPGAVQGKRDGSGQQRRVRAAWVYPGHSSLQRVKDPILPPTQPRVSAPPATHPLCTLYPTEPASPGAPTPSLLLAPVAPLFLQGPPGTGGDTTSHALPGPAQPSTHMLCRLVKPRKEASGSFSRGFSVRSLWTDQSQVSANPNPAQAPSAWGWGWARLRTAGTPPSRARGSQHGAREPGELGGRRVEGWDSHDHGGAGVLEPGAQARPVAAAHVQPGRGRAASARPAGPFPASPGRGPCPPSISAVPSPAVPYAPRPGGAQVAWAPGRQGVGRPSGPRCSGSSRTSLGLSGALRGGGGTPGPATTPR